MPIEQGVVIKMGQSGGASAWVRMARCSACEACSSRNSCMGGDRGQTQEVEAFNPVNAQVGDRIQVSIGSGSLLKAMILLYFFPIVCMLAGGLLGNGAAARFSLNASTTPVLSALVCLALAMWVVRVGGRRMADKPAYRPRIIRVLGRADKNAATSPTAATIDPHENPITT